MDDPRARPAGRPDPPPLLATRALPCWYANVRRLTSPARAAAQDRQRAPSSAESYANRRIGAIHRRGFAGKSPTASCLGGAPSLSEAVQAGEAGSGRLAAGALEAPGHVRRTRARGVRCAGCDQVRKHRPALGPMKGVVRRPPGAARSSRRRKECQDRAQQPIALRRFENDLSMR